MPNDNCKRQKISTSFKRRRYSRRLEEVRRMNSDIFDKSTEWRNLIKKMQEYEAARKEADNSNESNNLSNSNDNQAATSRANQSIQPEHQGEDTSTTNAANNTIRSYIPPLLTNFISRIIEYLKSNLF
ncbi:hypothetical protein T11_5836 [Trichinella zimbabwensis]|uniref:Uncharacterized protein n=1 Tax=Trichinella zimbabwensis TaxID=268475 RepID=A0A0V1HJK9_9BILA|nr:hypothetical protein T11_5836 [Trichinella zimbabwensis]